MFGAMFGHLEQVSTQHAYTTDDINRVDSTVGGPYASASINNDIHRG